jgi:hypothetical protein
MTDGRSPLQGPIRHVDDYDDDYGPEIPGWLQRENESDASIGNP